jgi:hypothetical protein
MSTGDFSTTQVNLSFIRLLSDMFQKVFWATVHGLPLSILYRISVPHEIGIAEALLSCFVAVQFGMLVSKQ